MEEALVNVCHSELYRIKGAAMDAYDHICAQVIAGKMQYFRIQDCYFVTFAEMDITPTLVIACAEGKGVAKASNVLRKAAKLASYKRIRIHAFRPGMRRLLNQHDWQQRETVHQLEL